MADHAAIDHTGLTGVGGNVASDSIWDAKGDLAGGTGANTAAKLTVGANKALLTADSAQTTGLKWLAETAVTPSAVSTSGAIGTSGHAPALDDHTHAHEAAHLAHDTLWAAAGDIVRGTGNDTASILSLGATSGMVLGNSGGSLAYFLPPGYEIDHVEFTSGVNITATSEATANTVVTGSAVSYDGSTPVMFEFYSPSVYLPSAGSLTLVLYDGSSSIGKIGGPYVGSGTIDTAFIIAGRFRRLVPSNASHTYSIRAYVGGAYTGVVGAGAGGSGANMPGFIRITKAA